MPGLLVIAPNWIGDALMAQPFLALLRRRRPDLRIDVLAPEWVAPVLRRMPEVDEVLSAPFRHGALQLGERWRFGRSLRARGYDQAIVLPNTWKAALIPFFADIPLRSGYVGESRYGLLNLIYRRDRTVPLSMVAHYARLADAPGRRPGRDEPPLPEPRLTSDAVRARATARRFGIEADGARLAVICPGAEYGPAKRWPAARHGELAARLAAEGWRIALLGSAKDAPDCAEVARTTAGVSDLSGRTSLDEAIDLIACADLVISNDSGLMHVAAALERPQVAIFGSSSPEHTPPRSRQARVIWLGLPCSPCYRPVCPLGHFRCMNDISVERVLSECKALAMLPDSAG